jgi:polyisoprenoid-binding protein YceI
MKKGIAGCLAAMGLLCASTLLAAPYDIDLAHSGLVFKVKHLGISTVAGKFDKFSGTFTFDGKDTTRSKLDVTVDVASVNTQNDKRDTHLRSADFFDAARFPKARFVSKKITPLRDGRFQVVGNLTLRGVTKPVALDVEYTGSVKDPWGGERAAFTATAKINRQNFGVKWNQVLDNGGVMVSDEVKLEFEIEGVVKTKK